MLSFSVAVVVSHNGFFECVATGQREVSLSIYPQKAEPLLVDGGQVFSTKAILSSISSYRLVFPEVESPVSIKPIAKGRYLVSLSESGLAGYKDVFLNIDYTGDRGGAFINGKLVADHLYHAKPWEISLRRFADQLQGCEKMVLGLHPLQKDAEFLEELNPMHRPVFRDGEKEILEVKGISLVPEYRAICRW